MTVRKERERERERERRERNKEKVEWRRGESRFVVDEIQVVLSTWEWVEQKF